MFNFVDLLRGFGSESCFYQWALSLHSPCSIFSLTPLDWSDLEQWYQSHLQSIWNSQIKEAKSGEWHSYDKSSEQTFNIDFMPSHKASLDKYLDLCDKRMINVGNIWLNWISTKCRDWDLLMTKVTQKSLVDKSIFLNSLSIRKKRVSFFSFSSCYIAL